MMKVIPHIAIDVKICNKNNCEITSYGKGNNGKIYSPDIFTNGRKCPENDAKCKIWEKQAQQDLRLLTVHPEVETCEGQGCYHAKSNLNNLTFQMGISG